MKQFIMCGAVAVSLLLVLFCGKLCCGEDLQVPTSQSQSETTTESTTTECCRGPATKKPPNQWHQEDFRTAHNQMLCKSQDPREFDRCMRQPLSTPDPIPSDSSMELDDSQRHRRSPQSAPDFMDPAQLNDTWKVVAGYARQRLTAAFCPEFTLQTFTDSSIVVIAWANDTLHQIGFPHGQHTLTETGDMLDSDGNVGLSILTTTRHFMLLRLRSDLNRTMVVQRTSEGPQTDAEIIRLFHYLATIHKFMTIHNGPAWFVCAIQQADETEGEMLNTESPTDNATTEDDQTVSPDV